MILFTMLHSSCVNMITNATIKGFVSWERVLTILGTANSYDSFHRVMFASGYERGDDEGEIVVDSHYWLGRVRHHVELASMGISGENELH
jgi:hypothetical protein